MNKKLAILGSGGFAREASLLVEEINEYHSDEKIELIGFIDEEQSLWGRTQRGYEVLGGWDALDYLPGEVQVICVIGDPKAKSVMVEKALGRGRQFINLVHPGVSFSGGVQLGKGVLINKGTILTTNIIIGDHVSINPGCGIGHDSVIGNFSTLMWSVNISGSVQVGESTMIGTGAIILQGLILGSYCQVGAGAVVTRSQPEGVKLVGVPARPM